MIAVRRNLILCVYELFQKYDLNVNLFSKDGNFIIL